MSTTKTPQTPDSELTPELIERLRKLSPESREQLIVLLGGSPPIPDPPPVGDWAYWKEEIKRRIEAVERGEEKTYTLEEAMAKIRKDREDRQS
jgi:putative addiction module component (TIGR02574 family)